MNLLKLLFYTLLLNLISISCKTPNTYEKPHENNTLHPPLMGWASWNNYRVNINENIIKSQADALVNQKLNDYGYTYLNIDDGYFGGRDENGKIRSHETRFPNGMKAIADYIHSKGLKAGIYSDAGINTCASYWDKDTIGVGMGLYGHDKQDLNLFLKEWDFDFIKIDWCGGEWLGLDEESRYTEIGRLAKSIKPSVIYNVCRWKFPGKWVTQVANSWRINGDLADTFESALKTIDANADLWPYSSYGHYNDMDMLQVGRGMTYEEDKTQFSMWCLMHSPLLLGNDLTTVSEETKEIITNEELIELNQSTFVYQARRVVDYGETEIWAKPVTSTMSGIVAVALLNRTDEQQNISFNLKDIGVKASEGYDTKDLWSKAVLPTSKEPSITKSVAPHGVVVLKITGTPIPYNVFQYKGKKQN
ncbi:glycoside hydrolase family 27 protein [Aestuariibaculum sp. YM273]|uniref:glycoside hydrolase family 27 protein n=1 Tax=Aestuariibaculum sp. YM273 TaxID=3070659 RepID=UPI0027DBF144|nr:glycoside hydrolase family 27 protein [Aestuariibaculum sp. YM273]WMI64158.1 glycoside hydrolase family 27 protein [Aestuariibaculum sp. YM273]